MARTKDFDPTEALDSALRVFWRNGYERTSVSDLLAAMDLNRGSLYDTFGDKRSLFIDCLSRYSAVYMAHVHGLLAQEQPIRPTLEAIFGSVVDRLHADQRSWGCFMTNTANELSLHDEAVATLVTANLARLEQSFAGCLARGQRAGDVPAALNVPAMARFLTSSFAGIATLAKTNLGRDFIHDAIQATLAFLG